MQLDVCLETVFVELPYEERIKKIAEAGYGSVEFWFHDATFDGKECSASQPKDAIALRQACETFGVRINNMVVNAPDGSFGGSLVRSEDANRYIDRLHEVIDYSRSIGCNKAITCSGNIEPSLSKSRMRDNVQGMLAQAASIAEKESFQLLLEPLNSYVDHPGYFLDSWKDGVEIVAGINSPALKLLYDVYHMQIMCGNVISTIERDIHLIGHFHSAGVPNRSEPFGSELNYPEIVKRISGSGYSGQFGLEYFPRMKDNLDSLRQVSAYLQSSVCN